MKENIGLKFLLSKVLDRLSKQVNKDLSNLSNWLLRANKLSLNVKKTELVISRPRKLKIASQLQVQIGW